MKICKVDNNLVYNGLSKQHDTKQPIPRGWIAADPPSADGIWQWSNSAWKRLEKYPEPIINSFEQKSFKKIDIRRACRELGIEDKLDALIKLNPIFERDWLDSDIINLDDPVVAEALQFANFDIEKIKQKIYISNSKQ